MELTIATGKQNELIDITSQINRAIPQNLKCGICLIHCPHTTAVDLRCNVDHLKSSLMGVSLTLPVVNGRLRLGVWQGVYFCEFDGPRTRRVELFFQDARPE